MTPQHHMRSSLTRRRWLIPLILLAVVIVGLRVRRERSRIDDDGHRPQDVARAFVEAVNAGDFEKAAACWKTGDVQNIEANFNGSFRDFCVYYFKCDSFDVTLRGKDKKSHVVAFRGQENGKPKTFGLFLRQFEGKWRLQMNKFIQDEESVMTTNANYAPPPNALRPKLKVRQPCRKELHENNRSKVAPHAISTERPGEVCRFLQARPRVAGSAAAQIATRLGTSVHESA